MYYDYSYNVAAFIISLLLCLLYYFFYKKDGRNKYFHLFVVSIMVFSVVSSIAHWGIEHVTQVPVNCNLLSYSFYLLSMNVVFAIACRTIVTNIDCDVRSIRIIGDILVLIGLLSLIVNIVTEYQFSFANHWFTYTPYISITHCISIWFVVNILIVIVLNRKKLSGAKWRIALVGVGILALMIIVQFFFNQMLLIPLGTTILALVICTALETPDYIKMQSVLKQIEEKGKTHKFRYACAMHDNEEQTRVLQDTTDRCFKSVERLNVIQKQMLDETDDLYIKQKIQEICDNVNLLAQLSGDLADFSHAEDVSLILHPEEYETVRLFVQAPQVEEIHIDKSIPKRLYGDVNRIRQVLTALQLYVQRSQIKEKTVFRIDKLEQKTDTVKIRFTLLLKNHKISMLKVEEIYNHQVSEELLPIVYAKEILEKMDSGLVIQPRSTGDTILSFVISQRIVDLTEIGSLSEAVREYNDNKYAIEEEKDEKWVCYDSDISVGYALH